MCGRYYVDDETAREIERIIRIADEKVREDQSIIFMAGIYSHFQDEDRFVILTTQANVSMQPMHDRMPLILEESEIESWIFSEEKTRDILQKVPCLLERQVEYEQMSLF